MKKADIEVYTSQNLDSDKLRQLISDKKSFKIENVVDIPTLLLSIEEIMDAQGLKSRVQTQQRAAATVATGVVATAVAFSPVGLAGGVIAGATAAVAAATGVGIGAHNLATLMPDYKILKNPITNVLTVRYQKKIGEPQKIK